MTKEAIDESKRAFVKYLLSASAIPAVSGCSVLPVFYGDDHDPIIDAHAHIFNSRDFQQLAVLVYVYVTVFAEKNILFSEFLEEMSRNVGTSIANWVERIFERMTPSFREENDMLDRALASMDGYKNDSLLADSVTQSFVDRQVSTLDGYDIISGEQYDKSESLDKYYKVKDELLQAANVANLTKVDGMPEYDLDVIKQYIGMRKIRRAQKNNLSLNENISVMPQSLVGVDLEWDTLITDEDFDAAVPYDASIKKATNFVEILGTLKEVSYLIDTFLKIKSAIEFFMASFRTHLGNAKCLDNLFDDTEWFRFGKDGVDHYVVASVDMDMWVNSDRSQRSDVNQNHTLRQQYALIEKTSIVMQGKILPMVAFDPWREYASRRESGANVGEPMSLVKECILNHGFVGVKLYPPMGFAPYGNHKYTDWPEHVADPEKFGDHLDEVLLEFFDFCIKHDVPVMAHANKSMYTQEGYSDRASAKSWGNLLSYKAPDGSKPYADLRLNLGHAGGLESIASNSSWVSDIIYLVDKYENVYMDYSNYDGIHDASLRNKLIASLRGLGDKGKHRIMYGSDWYMLAKYYRKHQYLAHMLKVANALDASSAASYMGENCLRFLGFNNGQTIQADRLKRFYSRHGVKFPKKLFN